MVAIQAAILAIENSSLDCGGSGVRRDNYHGLTGQ